MLHRPPGSRWWSYRRSRWLSAQAIIGSWPACRLERLWIRLHEGFPSLPRRYLLAGIGELAGRSRLADNLLTASVTEGAARLFVLVGVTGIEAVTSAV
jgi:hypothetical protein